MSCSVLLIGRGPDTELWLVPSDLDAYTRLMVDNCEPKLYEQIRQLLGLDVERLAVLLLPQVADLAATLCEYKARAEDYLGRSCYVVFYEFDAADAVEVADWLEEMAMPAWSLLLPSSYP